MVGAAMLGVAALRSSRLFRAHRAAIVPTLPAGVAAAFRRRHWSLVGDRLPAPVRLPRWGYWRLGGVTYLHTVYRCPGCEGTLTDRKGRLSLFPASCRRCGARFE